MTVNKTNPLEGRTNQFEPISAHGSLQPQAPRVPPPADGLETLDGGEAPCCLNSFCETISDLIRYVQNFFLSCFETITACFQGTREPDINWPQARAPVPQLFSPGKFGSAAFNPPALSTSVKPVGVSREILNEIFASDPIFQQRNALSPTYTVETLLRMSLKNGLPKFPPKE